MISGNWGESYLDGKYEEDKNYPFYLELETEFLFNNYDAMYKENKEVTELLNEEIPDICAAVGKIDITVPFDMNQ